jgi:hypothetical protein
MDAPDFSQWKTSVNDPLFVCSDIVIMQLEKIKHDPNKTEGKREKARAALRGIRNLYSKGQIECGISLKGIGWFISLHSPQESEIKPALAELRLIRETYGDEDTKFIVLTRELDRAIEDVPIVFLTGDIGLSNLLSNESLSVHFSGTFPVSFPGVHALKKEIDWESVLETAQYQIEENSFEVDLRLDVKKLVSKNLLPNWFSKQNRYSADLSVPFAGGSGVIRPKTLSGPIDFTWELAYANWEFPFSMQEETTRLHKAIALGAISPYLDFKGKEAVLTQKEREDIEDAIKSLTEPLQSDTERPTIQDPVSVMKYFLYFKYLSLGLYDEAGSWEEAERKFEDEFTASKGLVDFGVYRFLSGVASGDYGYDEEPGKTPDFLEVLEQLVSALGNCWSIGETKKLRILTTHSSSTGEGGVRG